MGELKIAWIEVQLQDVVRYFVDGFEEPPEHYEWFLDTAKGKLIIRAYVRAPTEPKDDPPSGQQGET